MSMNSLVECGKAPRIAALVMAAVLSGVGWGHGAYAQGRPQAGEIDAIQVRPNVYMLAGAGSNIVVHVGWMGVVLVDTGSADMSDKVLAAIARITNTKIRYIFNTSADADVVGGNAALARAGRTLLLFNDNPNGNFGGSAFQTNGGAAGIMAHENVLNRMSRVRSVYLNGDGIQVFYQPAAHSDADSLVFFRRSDVIVTGPMVDLRHFPIIDVDKGGSINGEIAALNRLVDLAIPAAPLVWHEDRTLIIPGHGRILDQSDVVEYRDMVTVIRDRIQDLIKKGMTLEQIKRAEPAKGYSKQYGSDTGPWTTDMFVTAVYRSLTAKSS